MRTYHVRVAYGLNYVVLTAASVDSPQPISKDRLPHRCVDRTWLVVTLVVEMRVIS